ncbi:MAG: hypothetical protein K8S21_04375 [Gemmatimonadetes bacterium]|nr:hypothetical protein [Gemmatimonadota bacterium]
MRSIVRALRATLPCALLLLPLPRALHAQSGAERCKAALIAVSPDTTDVDGKWCETLATYVIGSLDGRARGASSALAAPSARDLQSRTAGNSAGAGGAAQGEAVPTVQPTALASGSLAALGSGGGSDAVVAISLNPLSLFPSRAGASTLERSRLADVTILAPVGGSDTATAASLDYIGLRIRVNLFAGGSARALDSAESLFRSRVVDRAKLSAELAAILRDAPKAGECVALLVGAAAPSAARQRDACGRSFDVQRITDAGAAFRRYTAALRDSVDARYLGLDLRYDRGDPTFGEVPGLDGTFLFAGLAMGKRISPRDADQTSYGVRLRVGVQHIALDSGVVVDSVTSGTAFDAALAFEASYPTAFRPLRLLGGLEYRGGSRIAPTVDDALHRRGLQWRVSLDVPLTEANGIAVAFATPLSGGGKPTLNVSFNWQLLMQELVP